MSTRRTDLRLVAILLAATVLACRRPGEQPAATPMPTAAPPPSPTALATHRIGVRVVGGEAEFYDRTTGERFVPRGNNYIRLAAHNPPCQELSNIFHSTFNPGEYDPERAEAALERMAAEGYNTVRVFLDEWCIAEDNGRLSTRYVDHLADYLARAKANGIVVIMAGFPPVPGYAERIPPYEAIDWPNTLYLTQAGIGIEQDYWRDLIDHLAYAGAPLDTILGYELRNEAFFAGDARPFTLSTGTVQTGNGRTYDMADPAAHQALMDENLVFWLDRVRAAILEVDPTALVGCGFFHPQGPNPARPGDPRLIRTYPALFQSQLDFVDLHPYPNTDLTLRQFVENYELAGLKDKPVIMGEFGAFRSAFPSAQTAADALVDWQAASCQYGFDGWLLWTWDTDEQPELYNGLSDGGAIDRALAPANRPDPCAPRPGARANLALNRPATASQFLDEAPPGLAVNGLAGDWWRAGAPPPQWIEIDLGAPRAVAAVRLDVSQSPAGETVHRVLGRGEAGDYQLLHEFRGVTEDQQWLEFAPEQPWQGIRYIRLETVSSPSWVGWREIEVLGTGD